MKENVFIYNSKFELPLNILDNPRKIDFWACRGSSGDGNTGVLHYFLARRFGGAGLGPTQWARPAGVQAGPAGVSRVDQPGYQAEPAKVPH